MTMPEQTEPHYEKLCCECINGVVSRPYIMPNYWVNSYCDCPCHQQKEAEVLKDESGKISFPE